MIDAALAQAPNVQATIDATANTYLNHGVLGATIILLIALLVVAGFVIRALYRDNQALSASSLERVITGLANSTKAIEDSGRAIDEKRRLLDSVGRAVSDLANQVAQLADKTVHGFGNTSSALEGIAGRLERQASEIAARLEKLTEEVRDNRPGRGRS